MTWSQPLPCPGKSLLGTPPLAQQALALTLEGVHCPRLLSSQRGEIKEDWMAVVTPDTTRRKVSCQTWQLEDSPAPLPAHSTQVTFTR